MAAKILRKSQRFCEKGLRTFVVKQQRATHAYIAYSYTPLTFLPTRNSFTAQTFPANLQIKGRTRVHIC